MSAFTSVSGIHETVTVEDLIRYACRRFEHRGVPFRPSRVSKLIRNTIRAFDVDTARRAIDSYLAEEEHAQSWAGFELYVNGYADPTGERAAVNVDNQRLAARIRSTSAGRVMPNAIR